MKKIGKSLFLYIILMMIEIIISNNITKLKIGLKNQKVFLSFNQTLYEIKTNYLHLKLFLNNFSNIKETQISDKIMSGSPSVKKCAYSSNICQSE